MNVIELSSDEDPYTGPPSPKPRQLDGNSWPPLGSSNTAQDDSQERELERERQKHAINSISSPIVVSDEEDYRPSEENLALAVRNGTMNKEEAALVRSITRADEGHESEDEIVVLDTAQAEKVSFKPSSFEFNGPAPVHHARNHRASAQVVLDQLNMRISQLNVEKHHLMTKVNIIKGSQVSMEADHAALVQSRTQLAQRRAALDPSMSGPLCEHLDAVIARRDGELHQHKQRMAADMERLNAYRANMLRLERSIDLYSLQLMQLLNQTTAGHTAPSYQSTQRHGYGMYGGPSQPQRWENDDGYQRQPRFSIFPQNTQSNSSSTMPIEVPDTDTPLTDKEEIQALLDSIQIEEEDDKDLEPTPPELAISLMKHQRLGLQWMKRMETSVNKGGILADDMGLGKTIQTIALMMANRAKDECKTNLIVAPVSLLRQWAEEIRTKLKPDVEFRIGIYHDKEKKRLATFEMMKEYDVVLTSYGTLSSEWKKHFNEAIQKAQVEEKLKTSSTVMPRYEDAGQSYVSPFYSKTSHFYRIVLDEAQNIKNKVSVASKAATYLKGEYRFCLSGTPMQNTVDELFPIVRFLKIRPYNDEAKFAADIAKPLKSKNWTYDGGLREQSLSKMRTILKAILLRRSKTSEIDGKPILQLPEKHVHSEFVEMDTHEKEYYHNLEAGIQRKAESLLNDNKVGVIFTLLLRLRQACCHSLLVKIGQMKAPSKRKKDWLTMYKHAQTLDQVVVDSLKASDTYVCPVCYTVESTDVVIVPKCGHVLCSPCSDSIVQNITGNDSAQCVECVATYKPSELVDMEMFIKVHEEKLALDAVVGHFVEKYSRKDTTHSLLQEILASEKYKASAKIAKCMAIIKNLLDTTDEKIIVTSQFTTLFDIMKISLNEAKVPFLQFDGSLNLDEKNAVIKSFYSENTRVLLLSLKAGNSGLTLTCASRVIIMDPFWNPFVEDQVMDRAHRIGQSREVHVHKLLISGTIESRIIELQAHKKKLVGVALDEKGMKSISSLGRNEWGFLFGLNELNTPAIENK